MLARGDSLPAMLLGGGRAGDALIKQLGTGREGGGGLRVSKGLGCAQEDPSQVPAYRQGGTLPNTTCI